MLGYQKRKVRVLRLELRSIKAVAVDRNDTIGILGNDIAVRIHAECSYLIFELLGAVNDLALIKLRCQIREYDSRKLDSDADINSVGICIDIKLVADLLDPLAARTSDRNDTSLACIRFTLALDFISAVI